MKNIDIEYFIFIIKNNIYNISVTPNRKNANVTFIFDKIYLIKQTFSDKYSVQLKFKSKNIFFFI